MARNDLGSWWRRRAEREDRKRQRIQERENREILRALEKEGRQRRCVSSSQCGSGYGCVNGDCVAISITGGNGSPNSPGYCPGGGNDCNSGANACQSSPGCGSGSGATECCGSGLNYQSYENGVITVACDTDKSCDIWCNGYYDTFGSRAEFCAGREVCDPDCEYCSLDGWCEKKLIAESAPCWCDAGARCGFCRECITAPGDARYGECAQTKATQERCKQCATIESYKCCGQEVGPVTFCSTPGEGSSSTAVREGVRKMAREKCSEFCDNCEQKTHKTYCTNTTGLPDPNTLNCPDGLRCRQTGSLDVAGVQCVFVEETDISNCDFKAGRWTWTGEGNNRTSPPPSPPYTKTGLVAEFRQGDPSDPSVPYTFNSSNGRGCADGGCYPVMVGPLPSFSSSFKPTGPQESWGASINVTAFEGACSGTTFGCSMELRDSNGDFVVTLIGSAFCNCWDSSGIENPEGDPNSSQNKGCYLTGSWAYSES